MGWSRETLADRTGLSWSAIEQIESGRRRNTRPDTLKLLSQALGVTIDYLVKDGSPPGMLDHGILVFSDDDAFVNATVPYLNEGLKRSQALLAVITAKNIELLREHLGESAARVKFVEAQSWYSFPVFALNAYRTFLDEQLSQGALWARIIGEPVWEGRSEEEVRAWHHYESLLNLAFRPMPVTVLCPYDERAVDPAIVSAARLTHPRILEGRETVDNPMYRDPE
ncbi:MAG: MEDS domain-containing protein [Actinomycetota bacterium]|nr:MEDS domain-containing protein [Actinomycetota bacterium]